MAHALGTHLDLFQRIVISTCSISAIGFAGDGPMALTVNSTGGAADRPGARREVDEATS